MIAPLIIAALLVAAAVGRKPKAATPPVVPSMFGPSIQTSWPSASFVPSSAFANACSYIVYDDSVPLVSCGGKCAKVVGNWPRPFVDSDTGKLAEGVLVRWCWEIFLPASQWPPPPAAHRYTLVRACEGEVGAVLFTWYSEARF